MATGTLLAATKGLAESDLVPPDAEEAATLAAEVEEAEVAADVEAEDASSTWAEGV